jgi:hypothetical protein
MVLNLNIFESLQFSCLCFRPKIKETTHDIDLGSKLYNVTREYKISILPITQNFDIQNLYPITDHVELWNIFIIGNDKTYIMANINDPNITIPNSDQLPNHKGHNILRDELLKILDTIWDRTLTGKQLQFYIVWNGKLYFINTYPFFNGKNKVIGAILFMRTFETMEDEVKNSSDGTNRFSIDQTPREKNKEIHIDLPITRLPKEKEIQSPKFTNNST